MGERSLSELEGFFLALSDGTRLRLLSLMRDGEVSVGYLSDRLKQSQPKISRHLAYLRSAGLVETRREGKWIYYHIAEHASRFWANSLSEAIDWASSMTGETASREKMAQQIFIEVSNLELVDESVEEERYSNDIEIYLL